MVEVRLQLAGEELGQVFPRHAGPAPGQAPFDQPHVAHRLCAEFVADDLGRLQGAVQRRADDDRSRRRLGQVGGGGPGLEAPDVAEIEAGEIGVAEMIGVVHLTVAEEMETLEHDRYRTPVRFAEHIAHVDMDAFFVEVERRRRPGLRGVPVVVGGLGGRGVVASASYEARRLGVRSAMPVVHARRLCPHARFLPPDHAVYRAASDDVFAVLHTFTPLVEALSVDEAFLEISGLRLHYPDPTAVGRAIRAALRRVTGLPASVGLATSKFIAKLASDAAKPDGLLQIPAGEETAFLHPMSVQALWGVGEATLARLEELGVRTIGDLADLPAALLERRLGTALGSHLARLARADDPRPVEPGSETKSISVEITYEADLTDPDRIEAELLRHADRLAHRLRRSGMRGRTVQLKVRFSDFTTVTRSHTLAAPVDTAHDLYEAARSLLERAGVARRPVRLLGLGADGLEPASAPRQLGLHGTAWEDLEGAVDRIRARFGADAVRPARLGRDE